MMTLVITAALIGVVLGSRFKVLVLLPATAAGLAATLVVGMAHSDGFLSTLLAAAQTIAVLQAAYFAGAVAIARGRLGKGLPVTIEAAQRPAA